MLDDKYVASYLLTDPIIVVFSPLMKSYDPMDTTSWGCWTFHRYEKAQPFNIKTLNLRWTIRTTAGVERNHTFFAGAFVSNTRCRIRWISSNIGNMVISPLYSRQGLSR
jgi:hypothetical protein